MIEIFSAKNFFDTSKSLSGEFLNGYENLWDAIPDIKRFIVSLGKTLDKNIYDEVKENVWIAKSATVAPTAVVEAPCIVGENSEIRHSAYIRGSVLVGKSCVVGNSTEMKNSIIFDNVQVPHYNYVGDSILGFRAHLGAGAVTSNVKSDKTLVTVKVGDKKFQTGLKKFGAILGDNVEVGCGSVLCPGTVIGKNTIIYPLSRVRGFVEEKSIFKDENNIVKKREE